MKTVPTSPPMTEAMHQVIANLIALSDQLSELESGLGTWVPDTGKASAHTAEIRRQFAVGAATNAGGKPSLMK